VVAKGHPQMLLPLLKASALQLGGADGLAHQPLLAGVRTKTPETIFKHSSCDWGNSSWPARFLKAKKRKTHSGTRREIRGASAMVQRGGSGPATRSAPSHVLCS